MREWARDVDPARAQARATALLDATPDAILGVDRSGAIVLVNRQAEVLFGYSRDELIGRPIEVLVPERFRAGHEEHRDEYFDDPRPRPMGGGTQLAARRKDGTDFPADISLNAMQTEEGPVVLAAVRDVTELLQVRAEQERLRAHAERERLEARMQQSQRLESLGQLAGGVAHDFNNLLAVIVNYTAFVAEEIADAARHDPERWGPVGRDVEQIQRAADRGATLTHQLLAFGRREVARPRVLSLNKVVEEVEQLLSRVLGEHIELATDLAPDLWTVEADPGQLEQVLVNLALNARDAMTGGGRLTIDTANLIADYEVAERWPQVSAGPYVRLRVSDTGTGMAPEVRQRAFEPFYSTKPKGSGTGLGLATVYGVVTQSGGDVQIYSEPGRGTTIAALFPASAEQTVPIEEPKPVVRRGTGETVLLVEDEPGIRETARRLLARNGYQVLVAHTGPEALDMAAAPDQPIDLLLTDVVMPEMLGTEVAERLREIRPGVPVLFMSGYARPILAQSGTLEPGVVLLEKPFTEPVLLTAVGEVLHGADGRTETGSPAPSAHGAPPPGERSADQTGDSSS